MKHYSNCTFLSRGAPCNCPTPTNKISWEEEFGEKFYLETNVLGQKRILSSPRAGDDIKGFIKDLLLHHDQELIEKINGRIRGFDPGDKTGTGVAFESGYDQALTDIIEIITSNTL